jgi:carboxylesterase
VASDPEHSTAVLLIHGLGGTQYDLGSLQKILARCGVDTHAVMLPGHGTQPQDLLATTAEQWLEAVAAAYRELLSRYDTVHIIGMCMGALLAVETAKRGRLIALAAPVFIDGWSTPWYRGLRHLLYLAGPVAARMKVVEEEPFGIKNSLVRSIVKAKFERGDNFHYPWVPLQCVRQVDRLRRWVMQDLDRIRCPTMIVHAREDELTSLKSARYLRDRITGAPVEMITLENSNHMICVDNDRNEVAAGVGRHLGLDPERVLIKRRHQPRTGG